MPGRASEAVSGTIDTYQNVCFDDIMTVYPITASEGLKYASSSFLTLAGVHVYSHFFTDTKFLPWHRPPHLRKHTIATNWIPRLDNWKGKPIQKPSTGYPVHTLILTARAFAKAID